MGFLCVAASEVDERGETLKVKPSHTNETGDNSQNASSSPLRHPQDTTPKKMEKTEKEKENKERGTQPSSGSPSIPKGSPVKVTNSGNWHISSVIVGLMLGWKYLCILIMFVNLQYKMNVWCQQKK